uniref:IlGF domain-containing protein n=1 Tax=Caenorhabditis tropicalis TaxID=1561998 RepID=A0A1I7UA62_9PELO
MKSLLLFLFSLFSVVVTYDILETDLNNSKRNDQLVINQLEDNQLGHLEESIPRSNRASRIQGGKIRFCGRRLASFIFATCGECEPGYSESLSVLCCARSCDLQDIINACCPNSFNK